ncbi:MAG: ATPase, partial [Cyanobacteria bacterium J06629_9]
MTDWYIFRGNQPEPHDGIEKLIPAPRWRKFSSNDDNFDEAKDQANWATLREKATQNERDIARGKNFRLRFKPTGSADGAVDKVEAASDEELTYYNDVREAVNAALYLRRPLLITGKPGSGKTSLAYAIAYELNLGPV